MIRSKVVAAGVVVAALAACGGDDNSQPPLVITKANAPAVASEVLLDAGSVQDSGSLIGGGGLSFAPTAVAKLRPQLQAFMTHVRRAPIANVDMSQACADGGSITFSTNGNTSFSATFSSCIEGDTTINGHISATAQTSGTSVSLSATLDLSITIGDLALAESGDFTINTASTADDATFDMTSNRISVSVKKAGTVLDDISLSDLSIHAGTSTSGSSATATVHEKFTVDSSKLVGEFTIETSADLATKAGASYAASGSLTVTGANGTSLKITIMGDETYTAPAGEGQIKLEVGADVVWTNWADLETASSLGAM